MREIEKAPGVQTRPSAPLLPVRPQHDEAPLPTKAGEAVFVKGFRIEAESFPESELVELLADFVDKLLGLTELEEATRRISEYYRSKDILAHAYLPPQKVRNGIIRIVVVEGRLGKVRVDESQQSRIDRDLAVGIVSARLDGDTVRPSQIDEAVAVLNEVPGVSATTALTAGANANETDALLILQDAPILSGSVTVDNAGSPSTGRNRLMPAIAASNALGRGERLSLQGLRTFGTKYGKVALSAPVGYSGLSVELNATRLDYTVGGTFRSLNLHGYGWTVGALLTYPLRRSETFSLTLYGGGDHKRFTDLQETSQLNDSRIDVGNMGMTATAKDEFLGGGVNRYSLQVNVGRVDLTGNADAYQTDQQAGKTNGYYWTSFFSATREQSLTDGLVLALIGQGQVTSKNLDGSEQFSFGGSDTLRGYPSGQAAGDAGLVVQTELRWDVVEDLQVFGFYDFGAIRQHMRPWRNWATVANQPNDYVLHSAGLGATWVLGKWLQVKGVAAMPFGPNPGHDSAWENNDGTKNGLRGWIQITMGY